MIRKIVDYIGDPANANTLRKMFYISLTVIVASDFFVHREHANFIWDELPGWSAFYGFVSCVLIVKVSKFLGHQGGLMKKENYYDKQKKEL